MSKLRPKDAEDILIKEMLESTATVVEDTETEAIVTCADIDEVVNRSLGLYWQPINTVPKVDKEVLLYCPKNGAYIGCWMTPEKCVGEFDAVDEQVYYTKFKDWEKPRFEPKRIPYHGCGKCCNALNEPEPTHWMRILDTPIGTDSSEEKKP